MSNLTTKATIRSSAKQIIENSVAMHNANASRALLEVKKLWAEMNELRNKWANDYNYDKDSDLWKKSCELEEKADELKKYAAIEQDKAKELSALDATEYAKRLVDEYRSTISQQLQHENKKIEILSLPYDKYGEKMFGENGQTKAEVEGEIIRMAKAIRREDYYNKHLEGGDYSNSDKFRKKHKKLIDAYNKIYGVGENETIEGLEQYRYKAKQKVLNCLNHSTYCLERELEASDLDILSSISKQVEIRKNTAIADMRFVSLSNAIRWQRAGYTPFESKDDLDSYIINGIAELTDEDMNNLNEYVQSEVAALAPSLDKAYKLLDVDSRNRLAMRSIIASIVGPTLLGLTVGYITKDAPREIAATSGLGTILGGMLASSGITNTILNHREKKGEEKLLMARDEIELDIKDWLLSNSASGENTSDTVVEC